MALPVSLGGLGIRIAKDQPLPAFISALHAVRKLVDGILTNILLPESNDLDTSEREWGSNGLILAEGREAEVVDQAPSRGKGGQAIAGG